MALRAMLGIKAPNVSEPLFNRGSYVEDLKDEAMNSESH